MKKTLSRFLLMACLFGSINPVFAKDLGVMGQTYPIYERDLLRLMLDKLTNMQANGSLKAFTDKAKSQLKKRVLKPTRVAGIKTATVDRKFYFDPSIVLTRDVVTKEGVLLGTRGERLNPLSWIDFSHDWVFINQSEPEQVAFAKTYLQHHDARVILVKGDMRAAYGLFGKLTYFDQRGKITHRFGIRKVPTLVTREGLKLLIHEVLL